MSTPDETPSSSVAAAPVPLRSCSPLRAPSDEADWSTATHNLCAPNDEWPRDVTAAQSCFGHRAIAVHHADSSELYFFATGSGALTGTLDRLSIGKTTSIECSGEVPAGDPDTCAFVALCRPTDARP